MVQAVSIAAIAAYATATSISMNTLWIQVQRVYVVDFDRTAVSAVSSSATAPAAASQIFVDGSPLVVLSAALFVHSGRSIFSIVTISSVGMDYVLVI